MEHPAGSPLWWLDRLNKALDERAKKVAEAEKWYSGDHPIPNPPPDTLAAYDAEAQLAFQNMARMGVTNFLGTVVDVPAAKLRIEGFRFGEGTQAADAEGWRIWQRNFLDADSDLANEAALRTGQSFALVWAGPDGLAEITVEDPAQAIVAYVPGSRRKRAAGLKRWADDTNTRFATLYLPDAIYKFQAKGSTWSSNLVAADGTTPLATTNQWERRTVPNEVWPLANPLGVVTLIELSANRALKPSLYGGGVPEFARQITDQRRINQTVLDMLITMDHQAFRQRWVVGWEPPLDPATGQVDKRETLKASASDLMIFKNQEARVGEFAQADFAPFIAAIFAWVKVIASTSSTPPYAFLLGDMINVAADSLARIEGNLVAKIRRHNRQLGEGWEEIVRLALLIEGNELARDYGSSILWADAEERTATEQSAIATTRRDVGAPDEAVFSALPGVDQQEARRWVAEREAAAPQPNGQKPPVPLPTA